MAEIVQLPTKNKNREDSYLYSLPTGFPSPALDAMKPRISLDDWLIEHPLSTFFFRYDCDALSGACVPRDSILQVDRSLSPKHMDLIVCCLDSKEYTAGFYKMEKEKKWLHFPKSKRRDVEINSNEFLLFGVVVWVFSEAKNLKLWLD